MDRDDLSNSKFSNAISDTEFSRQKNAHRYLLVAVSSVLALFALNEFRTGIYLGAIANMVGVAVCVMIFKGVESSRAVPTWLRLLMTLYLMAHVAFLALFVHNGTPAFWYMAAPLISVLAFPLLMSLVISAACLASMIGILLYQGPFSLGTGNEQGLITVGGTYVLITIIVLIRERARRESMEALRQTLGNN